MSSSNSKSVGEESLTPIVTVAVRARSDALSIGTTLTALRASNTSAIVRDINNAGAGAVFNAIQVALVERLCIVVPRAYGIYRKGDLHLGVGFALLENGDVEGVGERARAALEALRPRFMALASDARCETLTHYRHKRLAHHGRVDPARPLPLMGEVYDFAHVTAELLDDFADGAQVIGPRYRDVMEADRNAASAFWSRWGAEATANPIPADAA